MANAAKIVAKSFMAKQNKCYKPYRTNGRCLWYLGHKVATWEEDGLWIVNDLKNDVDASLVNRLLNMIDGVSITLKDYVTCLNGEKWNRFNKTKIKSNEKGVCSENNSSS